MVSSWPKPIGHYLVVIVAISPWPQGVLLGRIDEDAVPRRAKSTHAKDHVNLVNALDCLDPDANLSGVIEREVAVMRTLAQDGELERLPGPRVIRGPLLHSFVTVVDEVGTHSGKNCIERAESIVALEAEFFELNMATHCLNAIGDFWRADSDPWYSLSLFERMTRKGFYDSVVSGNFATFRSKDATTIFETIRRIWGVYLQSASREAMKHVNLEYLIVAAQLAVAFLGVQRALDMARYEEFPESSSCTPFSQAALRLARFSYCFSGSELAPKLDDDVVKQMQEWDRGIYSRTNFSWAFVSRAAANAVSNPKSWHDHILKLIHTPPSHSAEMIANCARHLLPNGFEDADPHSHVSQENQARTLSCLPALLNAPGFQGALLEEKDHVSLPHFSFIVDLQCVMPSTCGRLGAVVLTAWQSRSYSHPDHDTLLELWDVENKLGPSEVVLRDCMAINSSKSFVEYDYSHFCFPQIMRYICYMRPACCPSLSDAPSTCSALSAEEFASNNTACNACRKPGHFFGAMFGERNWFRRSYFSEAASEQDLRHLVPV